MKKKFSLKKVMILSLILLFSYIYAQYNVRANSLYYAKHTSHSEEVDPEIMMLMKNRNWIYIPTPDGYSVYYKLEDFNFSYHYKNDKKYKYLYKDYDKKYEYAEKNILNDNHTTYYLEGKKVIGVYSIIDGKIYHYDLELDGPYNPQKEKEIYNRVRKLIKPILDANSEPPLINLQWLFDMKYEDYLN